MSQDDNLPTRDLDATLAPSERSAAEDRRIGPYRLISRIGEGGMGEVWLAEQTKPRRPVAIKLIRRGLNTAAAVARFEVERQALAVMDHSCIAKVYEAGETDEGLPYFAMEYVQGEPITDYCDRHRLSTHERLELFSEVCKGVQHAHQKALIHRDLKPSNVLVTLQDGRPVPKIIDFGIAKALDRELTEATFFTELGQVIGTPEYMAPEQAQMFDADVDTRADVYSLGVLLYELLAGARPFDSRELRQAGLAEIHRHIREVEPPKPSTRVSTSGDTLSRVAELRRTDASSLIRVLRGDLDWITLKALEKERTRRYGSATELLADVERHLNNEPVLARPPQWSYQASKFVRRHRAAVIAASLVLASLIAGVSIATWQAIEARRAQRLAQQHAERADRQAMTSSRVSEFLMSLFRTDDPYRSRGEQTLEDVLDRGLAEIGQLRGQPLVQSDLLFTLADAMLTTARRDRGKELLTRALELREQELESDDPDLLYHRWVVVDRTTEGPVDEEWRQLARATSEALGDRSDVISRYRKAEMLLTLGTAAERIDDDLDAARAYFERALAGFEQLERDTDQRFTTTSNAIEYLGFVALRRADLEEAESWYRRAVDYTAAALGEDHVRHAQSLGQYATVLRDLERFEEAETTALSAYQKRFAALGRETGNVVYDLGVLTSIYREQGKLIEAERFARDATAMARRLDRGVGFAACKLADVLAARGAFDEAEALLEDAATMEADSQTGCQRARGFLLMARGDLAAGDQLLVDLWDSLLQRDPINIALRGIASEAERAHREAGQVARARAWLTRQSAREDRL